MFAFTLLLAWTFFQGIDGLITFYMQSDLGIDEAGLGNYGSIKGIWDGAGSNHGRVCHL